MRVNLALGVQNPGDWDRVRAGDWGTAPQPADAELIPPSERLRVTKAWGHLDVSSQGVVSDLLLHSDIEPKWLQQVEVAPAFEAVGGARGRPEGDAGRLRLRPESGTRLPTTVEDR